MAKIDRVQPHTLPYQVARKRAEAVAMQMGAKYAIAWHWEASSIKFEGSGMSKGVHGFILVANDMVRISLELPMMLWGVQGAIDAQIRQYLRELSAPAPARN